MDVAECRAAGGCGGGELSWGWRMRASKGYVAGVGTTGALVGAIGCAFAVLSTVVAVQGWPLALSAPSMATLEQQADAGGEALPRLDAFAFASGRPHAHEARLAPETAGRTLRRGRAQDDGGPLAAAFGPGVGGRKPRADGRAGVVPSAGVGASAASPVPGAGEGSPVPSPSPSPSPVPPSAGGSSGADAPPPAGADSPPTLGGTVTQVTSGAGTVVSQTGQQLSGTVQGATGQLGGVVGQVSPAAGQAVAQTGQVVGGVVSGATGAAGQVVSGAGTAVGRLLGGLGRARSG
jgi:hypothetical protein